MIVDAVQFKWALLKVLNFFFPLQLKIHVIGNGVMLHVIPMSLLCPSKNEVAFKITIELVIDQN
jgi:hypothetical protein